MMPKKYVTLSEEDQEILKDVVRTSTTHRLRQRSQALLWSNEGKDRSTIADLLGVKADTVSAWFDKWATGKLASLPDLPRSGRPCLLSPEEKKNLRITVSGG
jgi:transposase